MDELKLCPFCGGEAKKKGGGKINYIVCKSCYSEGSIKDTEEEAVKAWNKRVLT